MYILPLTLLVILYILELLVIHLRSLLQQLYGLLRQV
jgi:cell division protein FtsB